MQLNNEQLLTDKASTHNNITSLLISHCYIFYITLFLNYISLACWEMIQAEILSCLLVEFGVILECRPMHEYQTQLIFLALQLWERREKLSPSGNS